MVRNVEVPFLASSQLTLRLLCLAFIKTHFDSLSLYERREILDYQSIWYSGQNGKKNQATPESTTNNHGYDDERGDYIHIHGDHLAYRYEIMCLLGKGSFGQVLQCRDHKTGQCVAIKIIRNKKRFHHQALVEVKILENLVKWVSRLRIKAWVHRLDLVLSSGSGGQAQPYQDKSAFLLPRAPLYRDGTSEHQPLRDGQSE